MSAKYAFQGSQDSLVDDLVRFQQSGKHFEKMWPKFQPVVLELATQTLRKRGVPYDQWAVDDVVSQTKLRLLKLGSVGAGGRFDPAKTKQTGFSGLRAWLYKVVDSQSVNWARQFRHGRKGTKVASFTDLEFNSLSADGEGKSIVDRTLAKPERRDLLPVLRECINRLTDPFEREVALLKLESMSVRKSAARLGVSAKRVHTALHSAYTKLRPMLVDLGIDVEWLPATAA